MNHWNSFICFEGGDFDACMGFPCLHKQSLSLLLLTYSVSKCFFWVVPMNVPEICNWNWAQGLLGFNLSTNSRSDLPNLCFRHFNHALFTGLFVICPWIIRILGDDDKDDSISLEKKVLLENILCFLELILQYIIRMLSFWEKY